MSRCYRWRSSIVRFGLLVFYVTEERYPTLRATTSTCEQPVLLRLLQQSPTTLPTVVKTFASRGDLRYLLAVQVLDDKRSTRYKQKAWLLKCFNATTRSSN